ncbi:MAG: hypothetical protein ACI9K5_003827 [Gammaproteobacteria bacterium]|jgi:hypothetical protein
MFQTRFSAPRAGRSGLHLVTATLLAGTTVLAQSTTYSTSAEFAQGVLSNVNADAPSIDQLQLNNNAGTFSILSVACGGLDTVVRINTVTGEILGEYRTAPGSLDGDPSRATTDLVGNVWVGNRLEDGDGGATFGSVTQVAVIVGGTRTDSSGTPDPTGGYLAPPFQYSTAVDRDGDGLIRTSRGLGDVLSWPDVTDGLGGNPALVQDSLDEAILIFQRTTPHRVRHLAVDPATNNLWAGGYPTFPTSFDLLDGTNGSLLSNLPANPPFCGGYAGLVDTAGVMWSTSQFEGQLFRADLPAGTPPDCRVVQPGVRGIALAADGFLWTAGGSDVVRISPDGSQTQFFPIAGANQFHGIAIDPISADIYVASSGTNEVFHLDSAGTLLNTISAGTQPRGLAFDQAGKLWVVNQGSDDAMRIDVTSNSVDLVVTLRTGSRPYNPSDMAGDLTYSNDIVEGRWTVVTDGGQSDTSWNNIGWSESLPGDSQLLVQARAANTQGGLSSMSFVPAGNNSGIALNGRFLEVSTQFLRSTVGGLESPVLFDLTVEGENLMGDCVTAHRRQAGSLLVYPEFNNAAGSVTVLSLTNTDKDAGPLTVEFVYIDGDDCSEFNRTEILTPNDTLTLDTRAHNPGHERGFVYVFAKDAETGEPLVANSLLGNVLVLSAEGGNRGSRDGEVGGVEYTLNPLIFRGIGDGVITDLDGDGLRDLDGIEYEMAPAEILIPRFIGQSDIATSAEAGIGFRSEMILLSLSGGSRFDTTLDFLIYNDNEQAFSAEHTFHCWEKTPLLEISQAFGQSFLAGTAQDPSELFGANAVETGWIKIDGAVANSTTTSIADPAFLAVLITRTLQGQAGADLPFELCTQPGVLLPRDLNGGQ